MALSDRRNIVVIADEALRSQYDFIDVFARHMRDALPQASFVQTRTRDEADDHERLVALGQVAHHQVEVAVGSALRH